MRVTALPFELDSDESRGFHVPAREIRGTVKLEDDRLIIAFMLVGAPADDSPHITRIDLTSIDHVSMTGGAVKSPRLLIETSNEDCLKPIPWASGCQCVLRFRRADGQHLRELIAEIEVRMADSRTREED
ncbi:MAG: hypothetical protein KFH98_05765 [Gemmatimonadetes bacterium]|nr:hypothetical protein [Gemmatimonadota bacterium]